MFETLSDRLGDVLERLKRRGALGEGVVDDAMREIRVALLEADVALPVVKDFVEGVREQAVGQEVLRSVTPGQMVVGIVHRQLVAMLGTGNTEIDLAGNPPVAIMMVGLQGSGKTTTAAKLGLWLKKRRKSKVLMASLDVRRPAAQRQLAVLGEQAAIETLSVIMGEKPADIAGRAMDTGRREGFDVVILDTAGRLHVDDEQMTEASSIRDAARPVETLLVADALTGQDAINVAREFNDKLGITGIVLTRVDGDARGGAALSMSAVTGCPIKLMGVGEKLDQLEAFDAQRIAGRILGMGDVVGLVEKAAEVVDKDDAEKMVAKMLKGSFTLDDMADQMAQLRKMGNVKGLLGMLPGMGKIKHQLAEADVDDGAITRQQAIILSMTRSERRTPKILNGSRRRRIAGGSGTTVQQVNRLLKQYKQMNTMMKKMGKLGKKGSPKGAMPPGFFPPMPPIR